MKRINKLVKSLCFLIIISLVICSLFGMTFEKSVRAEGEQKNQEVVWFGSFVQDLVTDEILIKELDKEKFVNGRTVYKGVKVAKKNSEYYKEEPIEWIIIDDNGGTYTLLSKKILYKMAFTNSIGTMKGWSDSSAREWLNNDFYNDAFSERQKEDISKTTLNNVILDGVGKYSEDITEDKVWLLDQRDVLNEKYGFDVFEEPSNTRVTYPTQFVNKEEVAEKWYLRGDPYWYLVALDFVGRHITENGEVAGKIKAGSGRFDYGIRPVIRIKKDSVYISKTKPRIDFLEGVNTIPDSVLSDSIVQNTMDKFSDFKLSSYSPYSNVIPGLLQTASTEVGNNTKVSACKNMTPQGVCVTDNYILISAYCKTKDNSLKCSKSHNSVIYVIDKKDGHYLTTLILNNSSHVGGLAFDYKGKVYVADSAANKIHILSLNDISNIASSGVNHAKIGTIGAIDLKNKLGSKTFKPSFVTYYSGMLYVGYCVQKENEISESYMVPIDKNNNVLLDRQIYFPMKAQGAVIAPDKTGKSFVVSSNSLGRNKQAYFYSYDFLKGGIVRSLELANTRMLVPYMSEDMCIENNNIYTCFESAANVYRSGKNKCPYQLDRIIISQSQTILEKSRGLLGTIPIVSQISDDIVANGSCGQYLNYTLYNDGTLMITDCGNMDYYDSMPWDLYKNQIKSVIIGADVTSVSKKAFQNCNNLEKVVFADTTDEMEVSIDDYAFSNCGKLEAVYFSNCKYNISDTAFDSNGLLMYGNSESVKHYSEKKGLGQHIHYYKFVQTYKPTCGQAGYDLYRCECGDEITKNVKSPNYKHNYKLIDNVDGVYQCEACGFSYSKGDLLESNNPETTKKKISNPSKTTIKKIKAKKKALKIYWKKVKGINGYKLSYSLKKNFKKAKTKVIKKASKTSITLKKLKRKKKYYLRIRTYKIVSGKTYQSTWSKVKSKKTK